MGQNTHMSFSHIFLSTCNKIDVLKGEERGPGVHGKNMALWETVQLGGAWGKRSLPGRFSKSYLVFQTVRNGMTIQPPGRRSGDSAPMVLKFLLHHSTMSFLLGMPPERHVEPQLQLKKRWDLWGANGLRKIFSSLNCIPIIFPFSPSSSHSPHNLYIFNKSYNLSCLMAFVPLCKFIWEKSANSDMNCSSWNIGLFKRPGNQSPTLSWTQIQIWLQ